MHVAVTGASGNVGTALLRALRADPAGPHQVIGLSRRTAPDTEPYAGVEWVRVDLSEPASEAVLTKAFSRADAVVHLAWMLQPQHNRPLLRRANQDGSRRVADAAVGADVPHLVHMSSLGTYAPAAIRSTTTVRDESWSATGVPTSIYSVDKAAAERYLDELAPTATAVTRVRPSLILQADAAAEIAGYFLGPLVPRRIFDRRLLRFAPLPRDFALQFVHADDVASAIVAMLHRPGGGAFNLAAEPVIDRATWAKLFGGVGPALPWGVLRAAAAATWRLRLQPTEPG